MLTNNSNIYLFGAGGHGRVIASQLKAEHFNNVAFIDNNLTVGQQVEGVPIQFNSFDEVEFEAGLLITIGDNKLRQRCSMLAIAKRLVLSSFVSARANVFGDVIIGIGSQVVAGSIINTGVRLGKSVIINSGAIVEHDCLIDDYCHIAPNATLTGGVRVGKCCWIGAGATILPGVQIPNNTTVGAGAVVTKSISLPGTYIGVPARSIAD
jgi:sugar O-acyltransferase (sialic acid O-acetyltransferase NeuD family)